MKKLPTTLFKLNSRLFEPQVDLIKGLLALHKPHQENSVEITVDQ